MQANLLAFVALLAALVLAVALRRRAARRTAEAEARARARRRALPVVSANLRGQADAPRDLWHEEIGPTGRAAARQGDAGSGA